MDTRLVITSIVAAVIYMGVYIGVQWYRDGVVNTNETLLSGLVFLVAFYLARTFIVRWRHKRQGADRADDTNPHE